MISSKQHVAPPGKEGGSNKDFLACFIKKQVIVTNPYHTTRFIKTTKGKAFVNVITSHPMVTIFPSESVCKHIGHSSESDAPGVLSTGVQGWEGAAAGETAERTGVTNAAPELVGSFTSSPNSDLWGAFGSW